MKITAVRLTPVSIPFKQTEIWHYGKRDGISNIIIELETDIGLTGLGEAVGFPSAPLIAKVVESMVPSLIGQDPHHVEKITTNLYMHRGWHYFRYIGNCAIAGLEMALWDLIGKAADQPVCNLLGGPVMERVPFYYPVPFRRPEEIMECVRLAVTKGFNTMYLKVGINEREDLAMVAATREAAGPDINVRVDANEAWTQTEAIRIIRLLEPYDLEFVEQPVNMYDIDAMARVRLAVRTPIAANQTSWLEYQVMDIIRRQAADVILTDQHQVGGLLAFKKVCALSALAGIPVLKHTFGDLGISTAAGLQVICTSSNLTMASQTHLHFLAHDIIKKPFQFDDGGALAVPQGPGLGVELDPDLIQEAHTRYLSEGEYSPFGPSLATDNIKHA